jgi:hypothetical protein
MLDFTPVRNKEISLGQLAAGLVPADLAGLTHAMVNNMLALIARRKPPYAAGQPGLMAR